MKRKKALELQQAWSGGDCHHPAFAKEYDLGVRTGNFICTRCGAILTVREKVAITSARNEGGEGQAQAPARDEAESDRPSGDNTQ